VDLDSFLVSLYVQIDDWWKANHPSATRRPGRPALLSDPEVLTLTILAQLPRFRSERDFWRFARAHLPPYFPRSCSQGQLNRRVRALEPELRLLQRAFAEELSEPSEVYRVLDTTLIPAIVRVRASGKGLFAGQASFGKQSGWDWLELLAVPLVLAGLGVVFSVQQDARQRAIEEQLRHYKLAVAHAAAAWARAISAAYSGSTNVSDV
jgi:hypothetical protein